MIMTRLWSVCTHKSLWGVVHASIWLSCLIDASELRKGWSQLTFLKTRCFPYRTLKDLKSQLDLELTNIQSNSDLMEKHLTDEATKWDDNELMDCKEIFLKMMDFIRNYDPGNEEYSRRIR